MARSISLLIAGFLSSISFTTLAATMDVTESKIQVSAEQCRTLLAPHAFSIKQGEERREWRRQHQRRETNVEMWVEMHTAFLQKQMEERQKHTQMTVACSKIMMEMGTEARATSRIDLYVLRPSQLPSRLTRTGGAYQSILSRTTLQQSTTQGGIGRGETTGMSDQPTKRTIINNALEDQESRRQYR